jgi:type IV pilus assembly protein PilA
MAQALQLKPSVAPRRERGFTLVEMMIVVAIVGILATLAVVGYRKIIQSSHVSEATGMVQNIRIAQEAYHAETQQYANVSNSLTDYYPAAPVNGQVSGWGAACTNCKDVSWSALPVHVDGPVTFGYATTAGLSGASPTVATFTVDGTAVALPASPVMDWYLIAARGDLDGDPTVDTFVYATSFTNQIFVDHEGY